MRDQTGGEAAMEEQEIDLALPLGREQQVEFEQFLCNIHVGFAMAVSSASMVTRARSQATGAGLHGASPLCPPDTQGSLSECVSVMSTRSL